VRCKGGGALFDDLSHPVQRLQVVHQRGSTPQACLGDEGRAQARQATLAFDGLQHGGLFAADVGTSATPQIDLRLVRHPGLAAQRLQLTLQQCPAAMVFVAQVDHDARRTHYPGGQQHAFEEAVRVGFEQPAVLEGAGFAFIDVDRHQPRRRLGAHDAPLARHRETGAAQATQAGVIERGDQFVGRHAGPPVHPQQRITATAE
jgi:nitroreductase